VTVLLGVLLLMALLGTGLTVFVIYFHGLFPVLRSIQRDPVFNELWQKAGVRFRVGYVGTFFGAAVGGITAGALLATAHVWQGGVILVLSMTIALLSNRERFVAAQRYHDHKTSSPKG
jgi:hypothetical protein